MTRIGTLREAFDRDMDFEAVVGFKFDGKQFDPGQRFPKTLTSVRSLRQLYDSRRLRMVLPEHPTEREERPRHVMVIDPGITATKPEVEEPEGEVVQAAKKPGVRSKRVKLRV